MYPPHQPLHPQTFPRLADNILLPQGLDIMLSDVLSFTLSHGEPQGDYVAFALLIPAGAFSDDRIDPGDILAIGSQSFAVSQ